MPLGRLSFRRLEDTNDRHHIYNNNGTFYAHFTVHFGHRKRRIRLSLQTRSLSEAKARRDELLSRVAKEGFEVPERRPQPEQKPTAVQELGGGCQHTTKPNIDNRNQADGRLELWRKTPQSRTCPGDCQL